MTEEKTWRWVFLAFESKAEGNPVQDWFDSLPEEDRYEIDLLDSLQKANDRLWPKEVYNALRGEGGISDQNPKPKEIPCRQSADYHLSHLRIFWSVQTVLHLPARHC